MVNRVVPQTVTVSFSKTTFPMLQTLRLSGPDKRGAELELWRDNVFQVVIF